GIDVSHHQHRIEWEAVAAQNIHFAFAKASEGVTLRDSFFLRNWLEMRRTGIKRGAYHFFRPSYSAGVQAQNFLLCFDIENGDLPPVLDVEVTDGVSPEDLRTGISTWLRMVETVCQIKPILYTNQKFFNEYLAGHFENYPVWIARYHPWRKPVLETSQAWNFWQYGNRGRLDGIGGDVDFNVFNGNMDELKAFCLAKQEPTPSPLRAAVDESITSNP
ncbi:MAG: GH25 family lysozyme, partial [Bacteroidota bacterium]